MAYATVDELADALRVQVTAKNSDRLASCLDSAAVEIDHYRGALDPTVPPAPSALLRQINIGRGLEWFKANDAAFGALGFADIGVMRVPTDSFERWAAGADPPPRDVRYRVTVSADLRNRIGRLLSEIDEDWTVAYKPADAFTAAGFMVVWGPDLWREPDTFRTDTARLELIVVVGRTDADAAQTLLEEMVDRALPVLLAAGYRHQGVTPPGPLDVGGVTHLTARIRLTSPL